MVEVDILIKNLLKELPKNNSESLKSYVINVSMIERLDKINKSFNDNETLLFKIMSNKPSDNIKHIIRNLRESNDLIRQSDSIIVNLLNNLRS